MNPLDNKYTRHYNKLIESRQSLNRTFKRNCGFEKHHIVPKSLGGSNEAENIIVLTPREHCFAHKLLTRMYEGEAKGKMYFALIALSSFRNDRRSSITSREYDKLRLAHYAALKDPHYRKMRSEMTAKQWTPERRARQSERLKKQWAEGKRRETFSSNAYKQKKSEQMKERWKDPDYQVFISETVTNQWKNPEKRPSR